jgi:spore coat polysaccharide biosynthesis protein SpsF
MAEPRIGAIVQARMGSTRLPGKVLLEAAGKPLLGLLVERLGLAKTLKQIIVATTCEPRDQPIVDFCGSERIGLFRGSEMDVLDRYYQTALRHNVEVIVRVTSDCPLIDPALIDRMVEFFLRHRDEYDLVTNRHPLTFPDGTDFDVMSIEKLRYVWEHATEPHQREHTVPYFWESGMRVYNLEHPDKLFFRHRWTLDYPEDYALIERIFRELYKPERPFFTQDILDFLSQHPELSEMNSKYIPSKAPLKV